MYSDELYHYGIPGQKWGVRRYQNLDRTLTAAGKERYGRYKKTDPVPASEKSKKEQEHFNLIRSKTMSGDQSPETWKEYNRIQESIYRNFNDASQNTHGGNVYKSNDAYKAYNALSKAYEKASSSKTGAEREKAWKEYWDLRYDIAGKALRSIGYEDTKEARVFLDEMFKIWA